MWLKDLSDDLDAASIQHISVEVIRRGKAAPIKAYLEALFKANAEIIREVAQMSDGTATLDRVLEEVGLTALWEARGEEKGKEEGREKGKLEVAQNLIKMGLSLEKVVEATELDIETVKSLYPEK
jgi:predicted transposase/invertase (TIGR01784 family)